MGTQLSHDTLTFSKDSLTYSSEFKPAYMVITDQMTRINSLSTTGEKNSEPTSESPR